MTYVLTGAHIKLYINNKLYKEVQGLQFAIDYAEQETYGIDSPYPQEIATSRISVKGSVQGLRLKMSGGLQGKNIRPLFQDVAGNPYISIRIQDRQTGEDIAFFPNAKVTRETHSVAVKGTYKMNFDFAAMLPLMALDRS